MPKSSFSVQSILNLLRASHWVKNLFIFIPAFFAAKILNFTVFYQALMTFVSFCLVSSAVYIINDIRDIKQDRLHPEKSNRYIASGKISRNNALIVAFLLGVSGLFCVASLNISTFAVLLIYLAINILYSFWLKHLVIVDLVIIGFGFLLRIYAGGTASGIPISDWLSIMVFLISIFMGLAKRRDDVLLHQRTKLEIRKNIKGYNLKFIDSSMSMLAGVVVVSYIMYTMSPELKERIGSSYIYLTSFFVIIGVMKYLQRIFTQEEIGAPVIVLFTDRFIQLTLLGWLFTFFVLIYIK